MAKGGSGGPGGGGGGNNRIRQMDLDDRKKGGPKMKGISWNTSAAQPAFLRNAMAALQGQPSSSASIPGSGRPDVPRRPEEEGDGMGVLSDDDEWDLGRGEDAPEVVVLKEGRHLERTEVDRLRAEAKAADGVDPLASTSAPIKNTGSLSLSATGSSNPSKRKISEAEGDTPESWEDVIKRSKLAGEEAAALKKSQAEREEKEKEKVEKKKKKDKKDQKKKVAMLSFGEEE